MQVEINDDGNYLGVSCSLQLALGAGELRLQSTDPSVQPFLNYNYLTDPFDRERMRKAVRLAVWLADHPSFNELIIDRVSPTDEELESDDALDNWLMHYTGTSHHISATCKMGPASDGMAVVDQYGNVHGAGGVESRGRVHNARLYSGQYQRYHHYDRREGGRLHQSWEVEGRGEGPPVVIEVNRGFPLILN